jgi:iron complex outermembrane recepter protein
VRTRLRSWFLAALFGLASLNAPVWAGAEAADEPLDEVIITGSHISGTGAAGSQLIVIDRQQIDASGYGRIEDVLATVTQNFNRANAAVTEPGYFNLNHGAEVQLRGLGPGTTLTLVDGLRQGASGFQGSFTDESLIPVAAIERIEILPEGASALYGSDAIGGVVNIILRKDLEGIEARVRGSTADGDANERSAAILVGHVGVRGRVLAGFQYNDSDALQCRARAYCAANADYRRFGGTDLRGYTSNPGTILDYYPVPAAIPHGQDGTQLTPGQLIPGTANYTDNVSYTDILPRQIMRSYFVSASYDVTDRFELSAEGRYSQRDFRYSFPVPPDNFTVPATNAFNHFGVPVQVAYDFTRDFGPVADSGPTENTFAAATAALRLPAAWRLNLTGSYARASTHFVESNFQLNYDAINAALANSDPATALNIFGDGSHTNPATLAALQAQNYSSNDLNVFTVPAAVVLAEGPLFRWRAGTVQAAVGGEYRSEHSSGFSIAETPEDRRREVHSVFAQLAVPIMGAADGATVDRLDLSLAGRYDKYSDSGDTFNPKIGLAWRPWTGLALRGNWGTSFRPPPFFYSNPDQVGDAWVQDVVDPPTGTARALILAGPAPDQRPETANTWMLGLDVTPPAAPTLSVSLTYFSIDYTDRIGAPAVDSIYYLTQEAALAPLITRQPTRAQIEAVCIKPLLRGGTCDQPIDVILDKRFRNDASLRTHGIDAALNYALNTNHGKWALAVNGTYMLDQLEQVTPTAPTVNLINTVGNPTSLRLVGNLSWSQRGWGAQATVNYTGGYQDHSANPVRPVDSWTTVDFNASYRVAGGSGWLANTQLNLGIINAFDQRPPFVNQFDITSGIYGYDPANASLMGRGFSLQLVKRWEP